MSCRIGTGSRRAEKASRFGAIDLELAQANVTASRGTRTANPHGRTSRMRLRRAPGGNRQLLTRSQQFLALVMPRYESFFGNTL